MSLSDRTSPYVEAIDSNTDRIMEIATWLKENPNAHPELRKSKMKAWRQLEKESERLFKQWDRARDAWIRSRGA